MVNSRSTRPTRRARPHLPFDLHSTTCIEEGEAAPRNLIRFETGEKVKVTDGPFEGFDGMVEDVDDANSRLKVSVSIFGRATPVELEFTQVSKEI